MTIQPTRKPEPERIPGPAAAVLGIAAPALVTPLAMVIFGREDLPNVAILYLVVIALVSLRLGYRPSLLAAVTSALCLDYCFTVPYHSLAITQGRQLLTFAGLFGTAVFISTLNERMRKQARAARRSERRNEQQAALVWALGEAESLEGSARAPRSRSRWRPIPPSGSCCAAAMVGSGSRTGRKERQLCRLRRRRRSSGRLPASRHRGRERRPFRPPPLRTCRCARRAGASVWWRSGGGTAQSCLPRRWPSR